MSLCRCALHLPYTLDIVRYTLVPYLICIPAEYTVFYETSRAVIDADIKKIDYEHLLKSGLGGEGTLFSRWT